MFAKFTESSEVKAGQEQYYHQLCPPLCCCVLSSLPLHGPAISGTKSSELSSATWHSFLPGKQKGWKWGMLLFVFPSYKQ